MPEPQVRAVVYDTDVASRSFKGRPVNDTWIAACCIAYELPLATPNIKDFTDFAEHDGLALLRP